jgi:phytanoyl-CoA hydroxylase
MVGGLVGDLLPLFALFPSTETASIFYLIRIHYSLHTMPDITSISGSFNSEEPVTEKLYVNDGLLDREQVGRLRPSDPKAPIEGLRQRLEEDNYLFLKGLLPREDVLKARETYFDFLSPSGVLKPNTNPVDGIFDLSKDITGFPGIGAGSSGKNSKPGGDRAATFVDLALKAHGEA